MRWRVIGFDADDTLWHNEVIFEQVHRRFCELLGRYHDAETVERTLYATEMRNLELYGYGIKGFMLSSIETAIELTKGEIRAEEIRTLIGLGREMMQHPVEVLDGVSDVLTSLAGEHRLLLITKGDLRDQERKLVKSGLARFFDGIEIVSDKNEASYLSALKRHGVRTSEFLMVGNSLRSDIAPVLALGGSAVHIPYPLTWEHERNVALPDAPGRFFELKHIRELVPLITR
jgi:putative hydrolase of the HAD superfamily